jgi:hypothetical protein
VYGGGKGQPVKLPFPPLGFLLPDWVLQGVGLTGPAWQVTAWCDLPSCQFPSGLVRSQGAPAVGVGGRKMQWRGCGGGW